MIAGGSKAAVHRAAAHGLDFISQIDRPEPRAYYAERCNAPGTVPGFVPITRARFSHRGFRGQRHR